MSASALPVTATSIIAIWAPSRLEAFAVGDKTGIFKWDGTKWLAMPSPQLPVVAGETIVSELRWVSVHGLARPRP
ncbi:hypothetical protein BH11MYX4_BH11MYX4_14040 [soil metagenome]